jgi:hypothetical protein
LRRRRGKDWDEARSEGRLFLFRNRSGIRMFFGRRPALGDAVLKIYDGYIRNVRAEYQRETTSKSTYLTA